MGAFTISTRGKTNVALFGLLVAVAIFHETVVVAFHHPPIQIQQHLFSPLSIQQQQLQPVTMNPQFVLDRYNFESSTSSISTTFSLLAASLSETTNGEGDDGTAMKARGDDTTNNSILIGTNKRNFFSSLDTIETLNGATEERSALLEKMVDGKRIVSVGKAAAEAAAASSEAVSTISYENPGSTTTFLSPSSSATASAAKASSIAEGTWKVVYAPHMTTASDIFRGKFDVTYKLFADSTIVSHAFYDFPLVGKGYLSVSGTYGSVENDVSNTYSRVDFNKAWIKRLSTTQTTGELPYDSLDAVPDSFLKTAINEIGKRAFIESVAVFPVSFLDDDTIVFEFEFLGTKICAHKV